MTSRGGSGPRSVQERSGQGRPEREIHDDRHMSDLEALMWNLDKDPFLSSTFGSLTILDRPPHEERFRERVLAMVAAVARITRTMRTVCMVYSPFSRLSRWPMK